jgi:hypothetical protein
MLGVFISILKGRGSLFLLILVGVMVQTVTVRGTLSSGGLVIIVRMVLA